MNPILKISLKVVAALVVMVGVFNFVISPALNKLALNQIALEKISSDLAKADAKLNQLKKIEKNKDELEQTKNLVDNYLPDDPSASSFILNIEQTSAQIPIIVESLSVSEIKTATTKTKASESDSAESSKSSTPTKSAPKPAEKEKALAFNASIITTYDKILSYFRKMEELPRFNTIESISIGGYDETDGSLNLKADGKIYYAK